MVDEKIISPVNIESEHSSTLHPGFTRFEFRKNIAILLFGGILGGVGANAGYNLVLIPMLVHLKASNTMIGFVNGGAWAAIIGSLVSPWVSKPFRYKKWCVFWTSFPMWAPLVLLGLIAMYPKWFGLNTEQLRLWIAIIWLFNWFTSGLINLPSQEMIVASLPHNFMGRWNGLSSSASNGFSIAATFGSRILLKILPPPFNMGLLFMLSGVLSWIPAFFSPLLAEKPVINSNQTAPWSKEMLLTGYRNKPFFRLMLISIIMAVTTGGIGSFIGVYAMKNLGMKPFEMANLALIAQIEAVFCALITGWIMDKYGPKKILPFTAVIALITSIIIVIFQNKFGIYLSCLIGGIASSVSGTATFALYYMLPKPEERQQLFTLQWTIIYFTISIGPIISGLVFDKIPFMPMFKLAIVLNALFIPFWLWVVKVMPGKAIRE